MQFSNIGEILTLETSAHGTSERTRVGLASLRGRHAVALLLAAALTPAIALLFEHRAGRSGEVFLYVLAAPFWTGSAGYGYSGDQGLLVASLALATLLAAASLLAPLRILRYASVVSLVWYAFLLLGIVGKGV